MLPLALNLLALLIVLGLCWAAMMWLGGRFHGQRRVLEQAQHEVVVPEFDEFRIAYRALNQPCAVCEGVGAQHTRGKLSPCPECLGTGVLSVG